MALLKGEQITRLIVRHAVDVVSAEEGRNDRSLAELDADGDGSAGESGAELVGPVTKGRRGVRDDGALALGGAGSARQR
jgi:hypothetical protein